MIDVTQDFFEFARTLPWQEIAVSTVCLCAGAMAHWVKKAAAREVPWNIWDYCIKQHPGRTLILAGALFSTEWLLVSGSAAYTWTTFISSAFMAGWVANSAFNKGQPPQEVSK